MNTNSNLIKKSNLNTIKVKKQWLKHGKNLQSETRNWNYERDIQKFGTHTEEAYDLANFEFATNEKISMIAPLEAESLFYLEDALLFVDEQFEENPQKLPEERLENPPKDIQSCPDNSISIKSSIEINMEHQYMTFKNSVITLENIEEENSKVEIKGEEDDSNMIVIGKDGLVKDYYANTIKQKPGKVLNSFDVNLKNNLSKPNCSSDEDEWGLNILEKAKNRKADNEDEYDHTKHCTGFWDSIFGIFKCNPNLQEDMEKSIFNKPL